MSLETKIKSTFGLLISVFVDFDNFSIENAILLSGVVWRCGAVGIFVHRFSRKFPWWGDLDESGLGSVWLLAPSGVARGVSEDVLPLTNWDHLSNTTARNQFLSLWFLLELLLYDSISFFVPRTTIRKTNKTKNRCHWKW